MIAPFREPHDWVSGALQGALSCAGGMEVTQALARALAAQARPQRWVALEGDLGAGKTAFARACIHALTGRPELEVLSPTFTFAHTYDAPGFAVWHYDWYRLQAPEDILDLAVMEALAEGFLLVEWPERGDGVMPLPWLHVRILHDAATTDAGPDHRRFQITGTDTRALAGMHRALTEAGVRTTYAVPE